jgi:hypothetical protein
MPAAVGLQFTEFSIRNSDGLQELITTLHKEYHPDSSAEGGDGEFLASIKDQESLSLKQLRRLQAITKVAQQEKKQRGGGSAGTDDGGDVRWLHEVIHGGLLNLPTVKSTLTPEEQEAQNRRRQIMMNRAAEREYQSMVAPLTRMATLQKRRQIFEAKLQYQMGVPVNMILGGGTGFLIGYYSGMHYFGDHNSALGTGCVCLFIILFIEMLLFTIRSL